ncbi:adenosylmethionine decarboxylase [Burkholderia glumae]|uniref:adenosylmethionine decarboxylase n=1 Tax=Burkholderia glumae TaxID=337 RepID=UPI00215113BB|nr:adenosylmethionine decarboxylase [Burkholderia glumae]UVT03226.1 adenosylmethionine decarboxylase [Burkholderia glumae]
MDDTGYHYLIDAHVKQPNLLRDASRLKHIFSNALDGFSVLNFVDHKFGEGGGVTGLFLLAESHCSYHTYPESAYIAIDVFTCGRKPSEIVPRLIDALDCEHHVIRYQRRGTCTIPSAHSAMPQPAQYVEA